MTTLLRTESQLVDDFKAERIDHKTVLDWLKKAGLKPAAVIPYGKGEARFYNRDAAYEVIRKGLEHRKPNQHTANKAKEAAAPAIERDVRFLVGALEEHEAKVDKLLAALPHLHRQLDAISLTLARLEEHSKHMDSWVPRFTAALDLQTSKLTTLTKALGETT